MIRKTIFNEDGERGTQAIIGGNTTNLREWNRGIYRRKEYVGGAMGGPRGCRARPDRKRGV